MESREILARRNALAGQRLACAAFLAFVLHPLFALGGAAEPEALRQVKQRQFAGGLPSAPSKAPTVSIPVEPLGFSGPGPQYLGERNALASLGFIDENRLLFTFRVPRLIHRSLKPGERPDSDMRQIRALVLNITNGAVEAEALWSVHDRARYLWLLKDGHFLVRDQENLSEGDAHLELKPLLKFPGRLLRIDLDPSQQYIVSNSIEPAEAPSAAGVVGSPATASASITTDQPETDPSAPEFVVRILRRETGKVMLVSRTRSLVHLPINSAGYLENLRGRGDEWVENLNYFTGGSQVLASIVSRCEPLNQFITERIVLATGCNASGAITLTAAATDGSILWSSVNAETSVWPVQFQSANGLRIGFETLAVSHPIGPNSPLGDDDVKGQVVRVLNTATGDVAFESPASPVLDIGGNAAISTSGRRVAVVNGNAIQIFDLPEPPPIPGQPEQKPSR